MKLAARYEIEAPVDFVYQEVMDVPAWEALAQARGAKVTRSGGPGEGTLWQIGFRLRGKDRSLAVALVTATPDHKVALTGTSSMFEGEMAMDLVALPNRRTRVEVRLTAKPRTLAARLYLQTLRLARKRVDRSFAQRIAQFAVEMEDRYRRPANQMHAATALAS